MEISAQFTKISDVVNDLIKLEEIRGGILKNYTLYEDGTVDFKLENLTSVEKIAVWLAGGGKVRGTGELKSFSFSANFEEYPHGLCIHYSSLDLSKRYKFIKELADEYDAIDRAIREGKTTPYVEFSNNGKSCGTNCTCYPS